MMPHHQAEIRIGKSQGTDEALKVHAFTRRKVHRVPSAFSAPDSLYGTASVRSTGGSVAHRLNKCDDPEIRQQTEPRRLKQK